MRDIDALSDNKNGYWSLTENVGDYLQVKCNVMAKADTPF